MTSSSTLLSRTQPHFALRPLALLIATLPCAFAVAQTADTPVTNLSPVSVTATRTEKTIDDLPPSVTTTDRTSLDANFVDNFSELGKLVPGIDVNYSGRYGFTDVNIRGLQGNRVLMMVDGIRLPETFEFNGRDSRVGQDLVDFSSLSAIDIVRGPGSTLYGSSALAGIVGLRTLNPGDILKPGQQLGALAKTDYNGADRSFGLNAALAGRLSDRTEWLLQLGQRKGHEIDNNGTNDSQTGARTKSDPQDYTRQNALLKLQHSFAGGHKLGLTGEWFHKQSNTSLYSERTSSVLNSDAYDRQDRKRISLEYDYVSPDAGNWIDSASARIYHQQFESNQHRYQVRTTAADYQREGRYEQSTNGFSGQVVKRFGGPITQQWIVGGELYRNEFTEFAAGKPAISTINVRTMPDTTNTQAGMFISNELGFAGGRFTLTPGLRYDHYNIKPEIDSVLAGQIANGSGSTPAKQSDSRFSPKLAANWQVNPWAQAFAQYAHGFRAPSVLEVNGQFTNSNLYTLIPNPALKPETSKGWELGTRLGDQRLGGSLTVFDTRYKNFIEMGTLSPTDPAYIPGYQYAVYQYQNVQAARIYGSEAAAHVQLATNWRLEGFVAWMQGQNETSNTWLNSVPSMKTSVALSYTQQQWGGQVRVTAAKAHDKNASASNFAAPGYGIVDLSAWWKPIRDVRVSVGVYNLFDQTYWNGTDTLTLSSSVALAGRYTLPSRNVRASLAWQF